VTRTGIFSVPDVGSHYAPTEDVRQAVMRRANKARWQATGSRHALIDSRWRNEHLICYVSHDVTGSGNQLRPVEIQPP
jgi:hypothetical protein